MASRKRKAGRAMSFALVTALIAGGAVTLTGCTPDARVAAINDAIPAAAFDVAPNALGVRVGNVASALKDAGSGTTVMVPVFIPDLNTAGATVTAKPTATGPFKDIDAAAQALADSGQAAWKDWLEANKDAPQYISTQIPVTVSTAGNKPSVTVDEDALSTFITPFAKADTQLFVQTAEALPQFQQQIVAMHTDEILKQITTFGDAAPDIATVDSIDPADAGAFTVKVSYPDPVAVVQYQAAEALKTYGTSKIWGGVSRSDFEAKMDAVTGIREAVTDPIVNNQATVTVAATGPGDYSAADNATLGDILAKQAGRYKVTVKEGSFQTDTGVEEARTAAVDAALQTLGKQVIKAQPRPASKRLVGGGSGMSYEIRAGSMDRHITFFKWGTSKQVVSVFVRSGKSLTFRVPVGSYRVVFGTGSTWYGQKYSYGPSGWYQEWKKSPGSTSPMKVTIQNNYRYWLHFNASGGGGTATPTGTINSPYAT